MEVIIMIISNQHFRIWPFLGEMLSTFAYSKHDYCIQIPTLIATG